MNGKNHRAKPVITVSDACTPRDLALIVLSTYAQATGRSGKGPKGATRHQMMPTQVPAGRQRVSVFDLTRKLRMAGYDKWTEDLVRVGVTRFELGGFARRGDGGYCITDWDALERFARGADDGLTVQACSA